MIELTSVLAGAALAAALAVGGAAPASAGSSGMAADFPVGTCIDYRNDHLSLDSNDVAYLTPVPCTDPGRDYRVTAQVAHANQCDTSTSATYTTRDVVVLCVVQDHAAVPSPIHLGPPPFAG
ncbi:MAG: hypothetical protein JWR11_1106 [Mycobacterium sp.]|nr:hypothetical protein [Mycobacterium sp.]MDT5178711.1 hypothetical protein [Mycobacterium sp.]